MPILSGPETGSTFPAAFMLNEALGTGLRLRPEPLFPFRLIRVDQKDMFRPSEKRSASLLMPPARITSEAE
jgi:hypothetical protein